MSQIRNIVSVLRTKNPLDLIKVLRYWNSAVRMHFVYAAMDSGLLEALQTPHSKEELIDKLNVKRPELLSAILDMGVSLGELSYKKGVYSVKGKRSLSMIVNKDDSLAALVQASVTYYNSVYRNFADRLRGAQLGNYLDESSDIIARFSAVFEPIIGNLVKDTIKGKESVRVLEIGCGSCIYLRRVAEVNPNATGIGIDMDENVVAQAMQNLNDWGISDRFKAFTEDIRTPSPHLAGPFHVITMYNTIYYFSDEERPELFRYLQSILASDGVLAMVTNVQSGAKDIAAANLNVATSSTSGCTPLPNLDEIVTQLKSNGFNNIKTTKLLPRSAFYGIIATSNN